jgi:hypothetical protein
VLAPVRSGRSGGQCRREQGRQKQTKGRPHGGLSVA